MHIKADLHIHTNASDGEFSPSKIVDMALETLLTTIAITDHDTIKGVPEALSASTNFAIKVIPGIEISAIFDPGTLHILGYFQEYPEGLENALENIQQGRLDRLPKMVERLGSLGLKISMDDVKTIAGDAQVGRPHVAKALIKKGYVKDFDEAFERFLGKGKPAYIEKEKLTSLEGINLIKEFKGLPVLAHPFTLELEDKPLWDFTFELKKAGLKGIEIYYSEHTRKQKKLYKQIALDLGLLITGGTDFHGPSLHSYRLGEAGIDSSMLNSFTDKLEQIR